MKKIKAFFDNKSNKDPGKEEEAAARKERKERDRKGEGKENEQVLTRVAPDIRPLLISGIRPISG